jgi:hypothetical protein
MKREEAEAMYPGIGAVLDAAEDSVRRQDAAVGTARAKGALRRCRNCGQERWWDNRCLWCWDPPELDNPPAGKPGAGGAR